MQKLPDDFQKEIANYLDESQPTPKDELICRLLESSWHKANVRSILNYLFAIPAELFFKDGDHVRFA